jgi:hypothetical protein
MAGDHPTAARAFKDLVVTTDPDWLAGWVLGQTGLGQGMKARRVAVTGPRHLVRLLRTWGEDGVRATQAWGRDPAVLAAEGG